MNILREQAVCDGYDVRVERSDGAIVTVHFVMQPVDVPGAVAAVLAVQLAALPQPDEYVIEGE